MKELDGSFRKKSDTSIDSTHEIHIYVREGYIVHHVWLIKFQLRFSKIIGITLPFIKVDAK